MSFRIGQIEGRFLFTTDARCFIPEASAISPLFANTDEILSRAKSPGSVLRANRSTSAFKLVLRPEKNTLPGYDFEAVAPLEFRLREPLHETIEEFGVSLDRFFVSREGALAYSFCVRTSPELVGDDGREVSFVVGALTEVRRALPDMLCTAVQASLRILSESGLLSSITTPRSEQVLSQCHSFELFDFSSELPETSDSEGRRSLAGFLRMTREGVWKSYSDEAVRRILQANLGNRNDELWLATGNRFFRMHPESRTRQDVRLWFEDLQLAVTILVLKMATLEFLCRSTRESLRQERAPSESLSRERLAEAWNHLVWIQDATARAADPRFLERNVAHSFFRQALQAIETELGYQDLVMNAYQLLSDYRGNVTAMASHASALSALEIEVSTEKLTRRVLWLTAAAVALMVVQSILAAVAIAVMVVQVILAR